MSLEKEPAGAFNKAQRLIERLQYTPHTRFRKEASQFVSAKSSPGVPIKSLRVPL